jgi:hypothetical protein
MPQLDLLSAIKNDQHSALLLDRRRRHLTEAVEAADCVLIDIYELPGHMDDTLVYAALLRAPLHRRSATFPREIVTHDGKYICFGDRFYLPILTDPDPALSLALFGLIASVYDRITSSDVNIETASTLLQAVLKDGGKNFRVLDFGCGTGLAFEAARRVRSQTPEFELLGTDLSPPMLELAASRGEHVVSLDEWRGLPNSAFDGVISAFVLHFGVPRNDLMVIGRQLRLGGRFAANFFKANDAAIEKLILDAAGAGLILERNEQLMTTPRTRNPMLVLKKTGAPC